MRVPPACDGESGPLIPASRHSQGVGGTRGMMRRSEESGWYERTAGYPLGDGAG